MKLRHPRVQFAGDGNNLIDTLLKSHGMHRNVKLAKPSFDALPELIKGTDLVATLPARLAPELFKDLKTTEFPLKSPVIKFQMIWHRTTHHSINHSWFRTLVQKSLIIKKHNK